MPPTGTRADDNFIVPVGNLCVDLGLRYERDQRPIKWDVVAGRVRKYLQLPGQ